MAEATCMQCHNSFPSHELFAVAGGRICGPCQVDHEEAEAALLHKHPLMKVALAGAVVPMVFSMPSSSYQSENGVVTHFEYHDWPAVLGGATALVCGVLLALALVRKTVAPRAVGLVGLALVLLAGGVHVARGLGVFARPPVADSDGGPSF